MRTKFSTKSKYWLSPKRFKYVHSFAQMYFEWVNEIQAIDSQLLKSPQISDMPHSPQRAQDELEKIVIRKIELHKKVELIEEAAHEAGTDIYSWLLYAVTNELISYDWLKENRKIPCGKNAYYSARRKFYWLLSQKI